MDDQSLFKRLNQLIPLNPTQRTELQRVIKPISLPKSTFLVEKEAICDQIYFVISGVLRSYCLVDDKEVTRWFSFPDHFATDYFSFVYQQPCHNYLIANTDATLLAISYRSLQHLCHQDSVWIDLNRRLLEEYYLSTQDRVMSFQTLSTAERYQQVIQEFPDIETQVSLGHLASFLGMSQETLSRLRQQRRQRKARQPN